MWEKDTYTNNRKYSMTEILGRGDEDVPSRKEDSFKV